MNVADLISETQRQLYGVHRGNLNFLATEIDESATTLSLDDDPKGVVQGALLAVDDELMLVRAASTSSKTVTVFRGYMGTEQVDHVANSIIEVQPRFPKIEIRRALRDEIRSWGSGVFRVEVTDVDTSSSSRVVDLAAIEPGWFHVLAAIRTARSGSDAEFAVKFRTQQPSPSFPYGALILESAPESSGSLTLSVARPFAVGDLGDDLDLEDDIGLPESMFDIPSIGACWRLLSPREINRLDTGAQGEPRSAAEVQAGMIAATARGYKQLRDVRLMDEGTRLRGQWPWRF